MYLQYIHAFVHTHCDITVMKITIITIIIITTTHNSLISKYDNNINYTNSCCGGALPGLSFVITGTAIFVMPETDPVSVINTLRNTILMLS